MRIPHELVTSALKSIWKEDISTGDASILETFIVAKYLDGKKIKPTISTVNKAVEELFVEFKDHSQGRIQLFRSTSQGTPNWKDAQDSGRKTVWNYGTRHRGQKLFKDLHFSNGLRDDLSVALDEVAPHRLDPVDLAIVLLRNEEVDSLDTFGLVNKVKEIFVISEEELSLVTRLSELSERTLPQPNSFEAWNPLILPVSWKPSASNDAPARSTKLNTSTTHSLEDTIEITVESRIMRMLEISISSHNAVVAVGPPGTGKTTLLEQISEKAAIHPEMYGLQTAPQKPIIVTPDESWTTRELVGGETIAGGEVVFAPGHILEAIQKDRWLILDEINRADMDRIFGSLFTWLSGKPVTVGSFIGSTGAESIILGWSGKPESEVIRLGSSIQYLAGDDWRLLGTYNAVDSAKVFRFGQALGRRFMRVPIPAASAESIGGALQRVCSGLPEYAKEKVQDIYRAHFLISPLGPALFLRIPKYIQSCNVDWANSDLGLFNELLAESYVINLGPYLAKLDDLQIDSIRNLLVNQYCIFDSQGWDWICGLSQNMSS